MASKTDELPRHLLSYTFNSNYVPVHPGQVLQQWLGGVDLVYAARRTSISQTMLLRVFEGRADITPLMALRLSDSLGTSRAFWLRLQMEWDLAQADMPERARGLRIIERGPSRKRKKNPEA
ncbi:HigA family addiction module antitoxin [Amantichitinum ursilacus]|uniref:Putative HTH-type transcriptional regulator YddM n=1 Tax=Amantichitinum ursilacus TaxID=857265 RepID=A0A0N1JSJ1_9NEIS|nr:HigA family addiction module antitoxin [Amantichitinum ursilacus]KPC53096.1 putative HTH-type transcriptional regulator YddM [Amantichitinum ursilacus]